MMAIDYQEGLNVRLTKAEMLVLFEFLARSSESPEHRERLQVPDPAEWRALWNLEAILEKTLVELFMPEYKQIIEDARKTLLAG